MAETRTYFSKRNAISSFINRTITIVCNFICRYYFVLYLGSEYLGVGGMFGNVFSIISLCELGFSQAVTQSMYFPLATNDTCKISAIYHYFEKVYSVMACILFVISLIFMPYLPLLFADIINIKHYRLIYLIFSFHHTLNFCFIPRRTLVISDQRMYAVMNIRSVSAVIVSIFQIFCLMFTGNYLIYLFLRIIFSVFDGMCINYYSKRVYKNIIGLKVKLSEKSKKALWNKVKYLFVHRIGSVINNSTDSILISSYLGLREMGIYSNYSLIINSVGGFVSIAINSASASIGNLGVSENSKNSIVVLKQLMFANFVLMTNCISVLMVVINPIISYFFDSNMCFGILETSVIIACFYMSYIRDPVQIFLQCYGVFKSTRFIILIRGILNLLLSVVLIHKIGPVGVFVGTLITTIIIVFPLEPYMLFKHGFLSKMTNFMIIYVCYVILGFLICAINYVLVNNLPCVTICDIICRAGMSVLICNFVILVIFSKSKVFRSLFIKLFSK